jgi:GPH family glycoside/pentoside/hexuronide:cation symporter
MPTQTHTDKLSIKTKLLYGIGDTGNALVNSSVQFFLLIFYTDAALLPAAVVGSALFFAKFWDAVNDPLFGWLSDRTTSRRFGKRRGFMILGAIPLALSIMLLWFVPGGVSGMGVFFWVLLTFILFDTLWTLTNVPYYSLTGELTDDYDERASLTTYRMALAVPAYLVGVALTPALVALFATKRAGYGAVGIIYGVIAAAVLLIAAAGLRERPQVAGRRDETPAVRAFLLTFSNRPFVRLLVAYLILNTAFAFVKTLMAFYLTYQLGMEAETPLVMGLLLICVVLALFPWKMIAERWNKGPAYAAGMAIGGLAVAATFLLPRGPTPLIYAVAAVAGIGFGSQWVFPWAMVPDVVDYDRLRSGEQRTGMYFGVWGLATKVSEAFALAASGWILALFHYVPNAAQTEQTLLGIRLFFGPIPAALMLLCLPLLIWYPITRASHREIRERLAEAVVRDA